MAEQAHTPGPWAWMGNGGHDLYLATTHSGRRYVMGFRRLGLQGAQPVFQVNSRMVPAADLLQFEVGDRDVVGLKAGKADDSVYRYDVRGIAQADARLIAAAPELLEALKGLIPTNVCLRNQNVGDEMVLPCDVTLGELRAAAAAIAKAEGGAS